jgi:hypothetical protein
MLIVEAGSRPRPDQARADDMATDSDTTFGIDDDVDDFDQDVVDDDLLDDDEDDAADPAADGPVEPTSPDPARAGERPADSKARTRAFARRTAAKALQLADASPDEIAALGALLGVGSGDLVDLTVAVMAGDHGTNQVVGDLATLAAADPFEASVVAQERGRTRRRAMYTLLHALGEVPSASLNGSDAKAAVQLAKAVHSMSPAGKQRLEKAAVLARKSVS